MEHAAGIGIGDKNRSITTSWFGPRRRLKVGVSILPDLPE
jgi:hypothetical protein